MRGLGFPKNVSNVLHGHDARDHVSFELPARRVWHSRRDRLPRWRSLIGGEVRESSFIDVAGELVDFPR